MTKSELIEVLGAKCGITVSQSELYLNTLSRIIYNTLRKGGDVQWHGLGRFFVFNAKKTIRRNPATGEMMIVPAHKRPKFKAREQLTKSVWK
jgi:DNA-binding protein HU-beta